MVSRIFSWQEIKSWMLANLDYRYPAEEIKIYCIYLLVFLFSLPTSAIELKKAWSCSKAVSKSISMSLSFAFLWSLQLFSTYFGCDVGGGSLSLQPKNIANISKGTYDAFDGFPSYVWYGPTLSPAHGTKTQPVVAVLQESRDARQRWIAIKWMNESINLRVLYCPVLSAINAVNFEPKAQIQSSWYMSSNFIAHNYGKCEAKLAVLSNY